MSYETIVGLTASILTAASLLPQLLKLIQEKKSKNVSIMMLVILFGGLSFWIYYGILKDDWIIIISNSFSLFVNGWTSVLTIRYNKVK